MQFSEILLGRATKTTKGRHSCGPFFSFAKALKHNPYHDELGRFSSGDGAKFVSTTGAFEKFAAKARASYNETKLNATQATPGSSGAAANTPQPFKASIVPDGKQESNANALLSATSSQWDSLSTGEKKAIRGYTGDYKANPFTEYSTINPEIGKAKGDVSKLSADQRGGVKLLDSALAKGSLPQDIVMFKAANVGHMGFPGFNRASSIEDLKKLIGKTLQDDAYSSMSSSARVASGFMGKDRIMLQLDAPRGSKGMWVGGDSARTQFDTEYEFVASRNSRYQVTGVSKQTIDGQGFYVVHADLRS